MFDDAIDTPGTAYAIAAIRALTAVIRSTTDSSGFEASTMMELQAYIHSATNTIKAYSHEPSVASGCELFLRFITRTLLEISDFDTCRCTLVERAESFVAAAEMSWRKISRLGSSFIPDDGNVLVHGHSRVVMRTLHEAAVSLGKTFTLYVTTNESDSSAHEIYSRDLSPYIRVVAVNDLAIGYILDRVSLVIVGAEAVVESGGIVNRVGTYQIALLAHKFDIPFYVAVEAYKFYRAYPLVQSDLIKYDIIDEQCTGNSDLVYPRSDYTGPEFITLLFTDLGALTPSAVSDELIKLYQ